MDSIKMEAGMLESPCSPPPSSSPHHQQFLFHLMRMRHFQTAVSDPLLLPSRPYLPEGHLQYAKRPLPVHLDQPLDFSAKKSRMDSSPSTAGWFHPRSSNGGEESREFSAAAAEAFISVAAAAAAASAAAGGGGDLNKHDSLGSDGHSDLSTSHSPQSNGSPRQEDLLYGHHSGPPGGQSLRLHPRAAANPEEEDNEVRERENSRSPPRLAIPSPSPSPEADPHQLSRHHHHNGLLTTVASLAQPSLPLLRAPIGGSLSADPHTPPPGEYKPALLGLPLPYFGGTSAAANKMGNPYALSLAIGSPANGGYRPTHHHAAHDSSPPRSASSGGGGGGGGPESMSELTKIAVTSNQKYAEFRENMLRNMENGRSVKNTKKAAAGDLNRSYSPATSGSSGVTTSTPTAESHMLLAAQRQSSSEERSGGENKDEAYWERRRKNNEAAKRSRDARRQKENEIAVRASFLEQENIQLKLELVQLRTELGSLRQQVHQQVRAN
jgi:hypothetical protein